MRIGLDIMGGDFAPEATVSGAILAYQSMASEHQLVLIGDTEKGKKICQQHQFDPEVFQWVHTDQVIEMSDMPSKAFTKKPRSSIAMGYGLLKQQKIDVLASAGNTGAMLVGAMYSIKPIPGVIRPAISVQLPRPNNKPGILLDVGLNPDSKPDVLYQYAILGSQYAHDILGIEKPRVALLNIGEEAEKGNVLVQATYENMKDTTDFHFVGNIEGNQLFVPDKADVVVCDGFVGNIVVKEAESFYSLMRQLNIKSDAFLEQFNFEKIGGTPILGVNANVIIGHGVSREKAIKQMLVHAGEISQANLPQRFKDIFTRWLD